MAVKTESESLDLFHQNSRTEQAGNGRLCATDLSEAQLN